MIDRFDNTDYWLSRHVLLISKQIEEHIDDAIKNDRGSPTKEIIPLLRHFVEAVDSYFTIDSGYTFANPYTKKCIIDESIDYVAKLRRKNDFCYTLYDLHENIAHASSHEVVFFGDYAERLFLKYYDALIKIKCYFAHKKISVLSNLTKYPKNLDKTTNDYYITILNAIKEAEKINSVGVQEKFYIDKKKIVYINDEYFYEYTVSLIDDNKNKADKIIVFSRLDIFDNYAVNLYLYRVDAKVFGVSTNIEVVVNYDVAIRECEIEKLSIILGLNFTHDKTREDYDLMQFIKNNRMTLSDILRMSPEKYSRFSNSVFYKRRVSKLQLILDKARGYIRKNVNGTNTLLYLLATMNNTTLRSQFIHKEDEYLRNTPLMLTSKVYPFEQTPFCVNLYESEVSSKILFETISLSGHECELIKREIDILTKTHRLIYCEESLFKDVENIDQIILDFNTKINNYEPMIIKSFIDKNNKKYYYVKQNEVNIFNIVEKIKLYFDRGRIPDYPNYARHIITNNHIVFEDRNKEDAVINGFNNKRVHVVYGPAGTGKSYLANKFLDIISLPSILCISQTNASLGNLKRRITNKKVVYRTVDKIVSNTSSSFLLYDFVIIDECSTISNKDMAIILNKINPSFLLLIGDTFQIQSIDFGNWFDLLRYFLPKNAITDLDHCFRTDGAAMKEIWEKVRGVDHNLTEIFKNHEVSKPIGEEVFKQNGVADSITLCLNYGGLFGINNLNRMIQANREGKSIEWRRHTYKVGDPIVFRETQHFKNIFYNNMKGKIVDIISSPTKITFTVKIDELIDYHSTNVFTKVEYDESSGMLLTFDINKKTDVEKDYSSTNVIPFSVAYAISIHKAQGLEYKSVNVVISGEVKEAITHSVFYTAITRARENLTVYWSPETEKEIIKSFETMNCKSDVAILNEKFPNLRSLVVKYFKGV